MELLSKDINDIKEMYKPYITAEDEDTNIIIAENTPTLMGSFNPSDVIFVFNGLGEMIVCVERVHRKEMSLLEWMKMKYKMSRLKSQYPKGDVQCNLTIKKDYIDFTLYKEWWASWVADLI